MRRSLRIVSGGQTGVDRAALDAALAMGVPCGGWCPAGRTAEDGVLDARYPLRETELPDTRERTRRNVENADGTLVLDLSADSPGTRLTIEHARLLGKPLIVIEAGQMPLREVVDKITRFVECCELGTLNVAGPRASEAANAYSSARRIIEEALRALADN